MESDSVCVIIEDGDLTDDEPGPCRSVFRPSACSYEASWFLLPFPRPSEQVVNSDIPQECLHTFQDLIWNRPHDRMVPGFGMTPKELASISSDGRKGWLVSSHFYWLSRCLNQQEQHTRFFVLDPAVRKATLEKLFSGRSTQVVKQLIFVMCVGRQDDGLVFFGTDKMQGDHWSVAVVDIQSGTLSYCDTLGWSAPEKLLTSIIRYTSYLGLSQVNQLSIRMAHEPNNEQHACTSSCTNYPLQKCSDVCGVIAMVCIAIAAMDKDLFEILMKPINKDLNLYLTDPTEYSLYLRHVLIYWLVSGRIDISRISLKSDFDPLNAEGKQLHNLKRKLSISSNGDVINTSKRARNVPYDREGITINQYILEAMATGIPSEDLLCEVVDLFALEESDNKSQNYFARLTFNNSIERTKDDALSLKTYVKDMTELPNYNPFILFKNHGKEMKTLKLDDILLAIQTPFQKEMMKIYGRKCICLDLTRKGEKDRFYLVTVLVCYEGTDELPVAWFICNRYNNQILNLFFKALKLNVGELQTEIFIGDMGSNFYKIWIQHFSKPVKKMFCMWDIFQVWNNRLDSMVSDIKHRNQIKSYLNILPQITDVNAFRGYVKNLLEILKQNQLFLENFQTKYIDDSKDELWASCYRHIPQSKMVPFLKPFLCTLKTLGFYEKNDMDRIDVIHHKLLQLSRFLENKLYIHSSPARLQFAVRDMEIRHQQPMDDLDIYQSASGEEWYIRASELTNSISVVDTGDTTCECHLICKLCQICAHRYVCTCPGYLLFPGSCKHIHLVHSYRRVNNVINDSGIQISTNIHSEPGKV